MARFTIKGLDVYVEQWNEHAKQTIVLLHGFTGSTKTWHKVAALLPKTVRCVAVDLIGHGKTAAPLTEAHYSMAFQIGLLNELFHALHIEKFTLLGYSMGGRVALSYAIQFPSEITHLLLESASPGLSGEQQRNMRKQTDDALAENLMVHGIESFVDKWENIPLFASQKLLPKHIQQEIREERIQQRAVGLANSLLGMGTGVMPALWGKPLAALPMPVTLITGALDEKFVRLNDEMQKQIAKVHHITIPEVGHAIHVENPTKFATIVKETIS
ncbi:2-succinyl-6-hydroxy-2,4-cyclohexadiene-1-carboxylate synthase [Solibacillus silvestris]|uniref:2-succinyl-6-hydroxy-2, 4-cyclohexadiene-1-carboxylate synthase n=1 Tax=Solibacillus silvestris TaxID=76853 RepID=UPI003F7F0E8D